MSIPRSRCLSCTWPFVEIERRQQWPWGRLVFFRPRFGTGEQWEGVMPQVVIKETLFFLQNIVGISGSFSGEQLISRSSVIHRMFISSSVIHRISITWSVIHRTSQKVLLRLPGTPSPLIGSRFCWQWEVWASVVLCPSFFTPVIFVTLKLATRAESLQLVSPSSLWNSNTSSSFLLSLIQLVHACMLSHFSHVRLFVTPWTVACQAPLSMGFSRQEYCSKLPYPPWRDLPNSGIKPAFPVAPALQVDSLPLSQQGSLTQPVRDFKKQPPPPPKKQNNEIHCMFSTLQTTVLFYSLVLYSQCRALCYLEKQVKEEQYCFESPTYSSREPG